MKRTLKIGGHLDRYVGSLFLGSYATALFLVVGLYRILDLASHIDDYLEVWEDGTRAPVVVLVRYYLLTVPFVFLQLAPFVTLVAGLFTVSRLLKHSEAVACLAAGVSAHRLLGPVFAGGLAASLGMFGLREVLSLPLLDGVSVANKRDVLRAVLEEQTFDRAYENLWLRDLSGSVVLLREFHPFAGDPPVAEVRGLEATVNATSWVSIEADRAFYVERDGAVGWQLENGRHKEVVDGDQRQRGVAMLEGFEFTPELALSFHRAREQPLELSFAEARELARRDPDSVVYQTLLQYYLTFPLANLVLLLVGLPLLMRHERGGGAEGLAAGCLLCVFYFAADFFFRNLGLGGNLDPRLASWLPILFFGSLGLVMFDSMRT
jgi:lipopolysaccharide export system permease protein